MFYFKGMGFDWEVSILFQFNLSNFSFFATHIKTALIFTEIDPEYISMMGINSFNFGQFLIN